MVSCSLTPIVPCRPCTSWWPWENLISGKIFIQNYFILTTKMKTVPNPQQAFSCPKRSLEFIGLVHASAACMILLGRACTNMSMWLLIVNIKKYPALRRQEPCLAIQTGRQCPQPACGFNAFDAILFSHLRPPGHQQTTFYCIMNHKSRFCPWKNRQKDLEQFRMKP